MHNHQGAEKCKCPHHKMPSVFMVLFGLTFLLGALECISTQMVNIAWPIIIIAAGFTRMFSGKCKCCKDGGNCSCCC